MPNHVFLVEHDIGFHLVVSDQTNLHCGSRIRGWLHPHSAFPAGIDDSYDFLKNCRWQTGCAEDLLHLGPRGVPPAEVQFPECSGDVAWAAWA